MSVFTDYVRALGRGEPPSDRDFARLWRALRDALRGELKRRGLWTLPPSYLGLIGWTSWSAAADEGAAATSREDALDELTDECYTFVFVDRLRSLAAQLQVKPDVEGLVVLDVRHFLHERQRAHDPLGYRVFTVARGAVRGALAAGELHLLGGDPRIRNETMLGFSPRAARPLPPGPDLGALSARWNDELLPILVTSQGRKQADVVGTLRRLLPELRAEGVEAFLFRELVDPLKHDARTRWAALLYQSAGDAVWAPGRGESGGAVRIARPDAGTAEGESFDRLVRCVARSLDRLEIDEKTRQYLTELWDHLTRQADRPGDPAREPGVSEETGRLSPGRIARRLDIPRARMPELLAALGRAVERCRAADRERAGPRPRQKE